MSDEPSLKAALVVVSAAHAALNAAAEALTAAEMVIAGILGVSLTSTAVDRQYEEEDRRDVPESCVAGPSRAGHVDVRDFPTMGGGPVNWMCLKCGESGSDAEAVTVG